MTAATPTQQDIQNLAWTMLGEANPGDTAGMTAVGSTVLNRLNHGGYGSTITNVVKRDNAYAAWGIGSQAASQGNHPDTRFPVGSTRFQQAYDLAQQLVNGTVPDNTGGAVNYRQTTPGTRWAAGAPGTVSIGGNTFQTNHPVPPADIASSSGGDPLSAFNNVGSVAKSSALDAINAEAPASGVAMPASGPMGSGSAALAPMQDMALGLRAQLDQLPNAQIGANGSGIAMPASGPMGAGNAALPPAAPSFMDSLYNFLQGPRNERIAAGRPDLQQVMQAPYNQSHMTQDVGPNLNSMTEAQKLAMLAVPPPYPGIAATGNTEPYTPALQIAATGNTQPYTPIGASGSGVAMPASGPMGTGSAAVQMPPSTPPGFMDSIYNFLQGPYNARVASGAPDLQAPYNQSHMTKDVGPNVNALTEAQKLALIAPANYHESLNLPPSGFGFASGGAYPTGSGSANLGMKTPPLPIPRPKTLNEELYPNGAPVIKGNGPLPDIPSWAIPSAPYTLTLPQPGSSNTIVNGAINGAVRNIVPTLPLGQAAGLGRAIFGGSQSSPVSAPSPTPVPSYHSSPVSQTPQSAYAQPSYSQAATGNTQPYSPAYHAPPMSQTPPSAYAAPPPMPVPRPAYVPPTITKQVLNPAYTQWQAQQPAAWDPIVSGSDTGMSWATQNTGDPSNPFSSFASVANRPPAPQQFLTRTVPNPNYVAPPLAYPTAGNPLAGLFNGSHVGRLLSLFGGGQNAADMVFGGINPTGLTPQGTPGTFLPHLTAPAPLTPTQYAVSTPEYRAAVAAGQNGYTPAGSNMLMPTTTISGGFRQNYGDSSSSGSLASRG